jgi:sulfur-carrier protein
MVELPAGLRRLADSPAVVTVEIDGVVTLHAVVDALERKLPQLLGTVREHGTGKRRAYLRFFACQEDISHLAMHEPLPQSVADGREPLLIVGAVSGG